MNNINKKNRIEIVERMRKAVNVEKDIELAKHFDTINEKQASRAINAYKIRGDSSFYEKIVEFGIKHNVSVNWIISGKGEVYAKSCLSTSDVVSEPEIPFCTQEELKYVNMVLDVLRGVNEQDKNSLIMNITSFHQHYMERRPVDPDCLKDLEKHVRKETENVNHIKKVQGV